MVVWMNKVGPYNNPQETYTYNSLPFCVPEGFKELEEHALGLGEILEGNELVESGIQMAFKVNSPVKTLCRQKLNQEQSDKFKDAIERKYWYEMNVDDLPVWGIVGRVLGVTERNTQGVPMEHDQKLTEDLLKVYKEKDALIYTHKIFSISYNGPHIIHVNVSYSDKVAKVAPNQYV